MIISEELQFDEAPPHIYSSSIALIFNSWVFIYFFFMRNRNTNTQIIIFDWFFFFNWPILNHKLWIRSYCSIFMFEIVLRKKPKPFCRVLFFFYDCLIIYVQGHIDPFKCLKCNMNKIFHEYKYFLKLMPAVKL